MSAKYVYVMKELNKTWPGGKQVIKDGWLSFYPGAKIGVLGSNGAGKSTLLKIMAGLDKEFSGEAWSAENIKVGYEKSDMSFSVSVKNSNIEYSGSGLKGLFSFVEGL